MNTEKVGTGVILKGVSFTAPRLEKKHCQKCTGSLLDTVVQLLLPVPVPVPVPEVSGLLSLSRCLM